MRSRAVLAGLLLAGAAFSAAPAQAYCSYELRELTGMCNPCQPVGYAYNTVADAVDRGLPTMTCPA